MSCFSSLCLEMVYAHKSLLVYLNDLWQMKIFAFDFDLASRDISNKRTLVDMQDFRGLPDGMVLESVFFPSFPSKENAN